MKRSVVVVALIPIFFIFSCYSPPKVETSGPDAISKIDKAYIESIDFYSDNDFTKPMPKHEYMDTTRGEVRINARKYLQMYGMVLLDTADTNALVIKIDICIQPGLLGVVLKLRGKVFFDEKYLFEITGSAVSPPNFEEIRKLQAELAEKIISAFAKKIGREKTNPPK